MYAMRVLCTQTQALCVCAYVYRHMLINIRVHGAGMHIRK